MGKRWRARVQKTDKDDHLQHEMRKYTATCKHYLRGHCKLGNRCMFAHPGSPDHPRPRSYAVPGPFKCMAWQHVNLGDGRCVLLTDFNHVPPVHGGFPSRCCPSPPPTLEDFPPLPSQEEQFEALPRTYSEVLRKRPGVIDLASACAGMQLETPDGARAPRPCTQDEEPAAQIFKADKETAAKEQTAEEACKEEQDFYYVVL